MHAINGILGLEMAFEHIPDIIAFALGQGEDFA